MADTVSTKDDGAAPNCPFPVATGLFSAAKKKAGCRSQKGAVAEHILEAVAATKERQATKLGAVKKTTSAAAYEADKAGSRPSQPADTLPNKGFTVEGASALRSNQKAEVEKQSKREVKRKTVRKRAVSAKPTARKRPVAAKPTARKPAAKSPRRCKTAMARKAPKRTAVSRAAKRR